MVGGSERSVDSLDQLYHRSAVSKFTQQNLTFEFGLLLALFGKWFNFF